MSPTILTLSLLPGSGAPGKPHKALAKADPDNSSFAALLWLDSHALPPVPLPDTTALSLPLSLPQGDTGDEGAAIRSTAPFNHHATRQHLPTAIATQPAPLARATPQAGKIRPTLPNAAHPVYGSQRPAAVPAHAPSLPGSAPPAPAPAPAPRPTSVSVAALPALLPSVLKPAVPPEMPSIPTGHAVPDNPQPTGDSTLLAQEPPARPDKPDITFWAQPALRSAELTLDADGHAVQVKIALSGSQGNEAHVTLLAEHAAERQALHGETGQLRDMLHEEGLHLAAVTVGSGERQHPRQPSPHDLPQGDRQRATLPAEAESAAPLQQRIASVGSVGSVDVFV